MNPSSCDKGKKESRGVALERQLLNHGFSNATAISDKFESHGRAVYKADSRSGERVTIRAYLANDAMKKEAAREVIRLSELHHPHIVQPKSLIRTPDFLCIVTEYANGGDLFRMVRRGGAHGLPVPAARFLFQQLILALQFCHCVGIYIRNINPSNLLIFWNDKGMPILKISDFHVAKDVRLQGPAQTPVVATMYTCPHMIRQAGRSLTEWEDLAPVCDVWSAVVTLYFLLTGRWPFSKEQIISWASTPEADWNDAEQALTAIAEADLPKDVVDLFKTIFTGGSKSADEFKKTCPRIEHISKMKWFLEDLPAEAGSMTEVYQQKTEMRRQSPALLRLKGLVDKITTPQVGQDVKPLHNVGAHANKGVNQQDALGKTGKAPAVADIHAP